MSNRMADTHDHWAYRLPGAGHTATGVRPDSGDDEDDLLWAGPNDGGVKRGDSAETGDNEARPAEGTGPGGSGVYGGEPGGAQGFPTGNASGLGGGAGTSGAGGAAGSEDLLTFGDSAIDDLTIMDADDPSLGLTNIGDVPAEDWAADTGPTRSAEGDVYVSTGSLDDDSATLGGGEKSDRPPGGSGRTGSGGGDTESSQDHGTTGTGGAAERT